MDPVLGCDASLVHAMTVMATWQERARVVHEGDALFVAGERRFPSPYSNTVFPTAPQDPDDLLSRASGRFPDRRFFVWAREPFRSEVERAAVRRGFTSLGTLPGMVVEARVDGRTPLELEVTRAEGAAAVADLLSVSRRAYAEAGLPEEIAASLLARGDRIVDSADVFVARSSGRPIAAALSITDPGTGVGGVYWVGTVPEARRRGAADAVTRAATNAAFDRGARVVTLQASEAGRPVYLRMGYREVCRYERFLSPKVAR